MNAKALKALADVVEETADLLARVTVLAEPRIIVWRIVSKDPDEISEYAGFLVNETDDAFNIRVDGDSIITTFPKTTPAGFTAWRRA